MNPLMRAHRGGAGGGGSGTPPPVAPGQWSNPLTWGGAIPVDGEDVVIPAGMAVTLDTTTAILNSLTISGDLIVSTTVDTELRTKQLIGKGTGRYLSGTDTVPNLRTHIRTMYGNALVGNNPGPSHVSFTNTAVSNYPGDSGGIEGRAGAIRGFLMEDHFQYKINGYFPARTETRVNLAAVGGNSRLAAGTTVIPLADGVDWKAGDKIIIGPTGYYDASKRTEMFTVVADTNGLASVTITPGLGYDRWAKLQYLNDNNTVTVDSSSGFTTTTGGLRATNNIPATIDQRARVMHMSRRHLVQGFNDSQITDKRFGSHDMVMSINCKIVLKGVRWHNAGQGGLQGRYPFHYHLPSYTPATGAVLGEYAVGDALLEDCTFTNCFNRFLTYHGVRGAIGRRLFGFDTFGHGFFFEDASEIHNTLEDSRGYLLRDPGLGSTAAQIAYAPRGYRIKKHDGVSGNFGDEGGPSGLWITNLDNTIQRNSFGDTEGPAIWNSISTSLASTFPGTAECWGPSKNVVLYPFSTPPLLWDRNEGHSCRSHGREGFISQSDESGTIGGNAKLRPTDTHVPGGSDVDYVMTGDFYWKCGDGIDTGSGYHHTVYRPKYSRFTFADNLNLDLHGSTQQGNATDFCFIEQSANNEGFNRYGYGPRVGAVTYHGTFHLYDTTAIGYAPTTPVIALSETRLLLWMNGVFAGFDNYDGPNFFFSKTFPNMRVGVGFSMYMTPGGNIQCVPPYTTWNPSLIQSTAGNRESTNHCSAFYDHYGTFFGQGAGITCINDMPFFTTDITSTPLTANGIPIGMRKTTGVTWIGVKGLNGEFTGSTDPALAMQRCNPATLSDYSGATFPLGYQIAMPARAAVRQVNASGDWTHAKWLLNKGFNTDATEYILFGAPVQNSRTLSRVDILTSNVFLTTGTPIAVASPNTKAGLLASTANAYWRDTTTGTVWCKVYPPADAQYNETIGTASFTDDYQYGLLVTCS